MNAETESDHEKKNGGAKRGTIGAAAKPLGPRAPS